MKTESPKTDTTPKLKYSSTLVIVLLAVIIVILMITRYNKAPEPLPPAVTDSSHVNRIPPDSLPH